MKGFKNHLLAGSGVLVLLGFFVVGGPRATRASEDARPTGRQSIPFIQTRSERAPENRRLVAPSRLASSSVLLATAPDAPDTQKDLLIDASVADRQFVIERHRTGGDRNKYLEIKLKEVLISGVSPTGDPSGDIELNATITGPDQVPGSLLYALAWLAGDPDPLGSVQALGYLIDVLREHDQPCSDGLSSPTCVEHARRLATLLDATLALGASEDRIQFRQGAVALGIPPDCAARTGP